MQTFVDSQRDSEERFLKYEERRAKEERAHEEHMLPLLLFAPSTSTAPPCFPPQSFHYYEGNYPPHMQQLDSDNYNYPST